MKPCHTPHASPDKERGGDENDLAELPLAKSNMATDEGSLFTWKLKEMQLFICLGTGVAADTTSISSDGKATLPRNIAVHRQHDKPSRIVRAEKYVYLR